MIPPSETPSLPVCGVRIDLLDRQGAQRWVLDARHGGRFRYVVTPNAQHLVKLVEDGGDLRRLYAEAGLCINDSRVVAKAVRLIAGATLPVAPGSDLTADLLDALQAECGARVAIVGLDAAHLPLLRSRYPSIDFHHHNPPMGFINRPAEVDRCLSFLNAAAAPVVLFAVGFPRQEMLAARYAAQASAGGVGLCIGASLDFLVGAQKRAPAVIQKLHLEWAWRLAGDPRRLAARYLVESPRMFWYCWRRRAETRAAARKQSVGA